MCACCNYSGLSGVKLALIHKQMLEMEEENKDPEQMREIIGLIYSKDKKKVKKDAGSSGEAEDE